MFRLAADLLRPSGRPDAGRQIFARGRTSPGTLCEVTVVDRKSPKYGVRQPAFELRIVAELLEQFGVVLQQPDS